MERRRHRRIPITIRVDLVLPEETLFGVSRDLCPRGLFILLPADVARRVPDIVRINVRIWTGQVHISRQLRTRVVRRCTDGIAVQFQENDLLARAAADEVLFYMGVERYNREVVSEWRDQVEAEDHVA